MEGVPKDILKAISETILWKGSNRNLDLIRIIFGERKVNGIQGYCIDPRGRSRFDHSE